MIEYGSESNKLIRATWKEATEIARLDTDDALDTALTSLDGANPVTGRTDHDELSDLLKQRYATGIRKATKDNKFEEFTNILPDVGIELYAQHIITRLYRKIVSALASLFTQPDQKFEYTNELDEAIEDIEALIDWHRDKGGCIQALIRCDRLAVGLGASALRLAWGPGGNIVYHPTAPQTIHALWSPRIIDGDNTRAPDYTDIEDASMVAVDLGQDMSNTHHHRWLAYIGRQPGWEKGRRVVYSASGYDKVPDPGDDSIIEEYLSLSGEICNPLTWLQDDLGADLVPYEYPLVRFIGNDAGKASGQWLPTNGLALWNDCQELDVAWSRVMSSAVDAAKDTILLKSGDHPTLPRNLSNAIHLKSNQEASLLGLNANNAKIAAEVLEKLSGTIANAWNVPSHMVIADAARMANSGYQIALMSQPLLDARRERVELNEASVQKLFDLEREMIAAHDPGNTIPDVVEQSWDAGEWRPPINRQEQLADLKAAKELGLVDQVEMVREYYDLATDSDAMALIKKQADRAGEYPTKSPAAEGVGQSPFRRQLPNLPPRPPKGQPPEAEQQQPE